MIAGIVIFTISAIFYVMLEIYLRRSIAPKATRSKAAKVIILAADIILALHIIIIAGLVYVRFFRQVKTRSVLADASAFTDLFYIFKIHLYFRLKNKLFLKQIYFHLKINSSLTLRFFFSSVPKINFFSKLTLA